MLRNNNNSEQEVKISSLPPLYFYSMGNNIHSTKGREQLIDNYVDSLKSPVMKGFQVKDFNFNGEEIKVLLNDDFPLAFKTLIRAYLKKAIGVVFIVDCRIEPMNALKNKWNAALSNTLNSNQFSENQNNQELNDLIWQLRQFKNASTVLSSGQRSLANLQEGLSVSELNIPVFLVAIYDNAGSQITFETLQEQVIDKGFSSIKLINIDNKEDIKNNLDVVLQIALEYQYNRKLEKRSVSSSEATNTTQPKR